MPRLIDAEERNAEIARAALRVLENEGMSALSVRNVAAEAGIAPASLRRAFPSQHSLREYCIELIEERATARIASIKLIGRELVDEVLAQLLPLDGERRMEMIAQTQLGVLSLTDESLRPATARMNEGVERGCRYAIEVLIREGQFNSSRDSERNTTAPCVARWNRDAVVVERYRRIVTTCTRNARTSHRRAGLVCVYEVSPAGRGWRTMPWVCCGLIPLEFTLARRLLLGVLVCRLRTELRTRESRRSSFRGRKGTRRGFPKLFQGWGRYLW